MKTLSLFSLVLTLTAFADPPYRPDENHLSHEDAIQMQQEQEDIEIIESKKTEEKKNQQHQEVRGEDLNYNSIDENLRENIQQHP